MSRDKRKRRGGMAYPSSIIDPATGESLSGGPNTPEAKAQAIAVQRGVQAARRR